MAKGRASKTPPCDAIASEPAPAGAETAAGTPPKRKKQSKKQQQLTEWLHHREEGRRHYENADRILDAIMKKMAPGAKVKHPVTGEEFVVVDNFASKSKCWTVTAVRRFDLKPVKGTRITPVS